jgi:competence protein ComEC
VLHPANVLLSDATSQNNDSVVVRVVFGDREFLLTGDIERDAEAAILSDPAADVRADIVKVAHHGSRTSSTETFVKNTGPDVAVISVGKRSRFGHPHPEVIERWKIADAQIIKTGEKGTVTISTDGSDLQIRTFVP